MIRTPTVFVVGAGASAPYGLPIAPKVLKRVLELPGFFEVTQGRVPQDQEVLSALVRLTGADFLHIWPFAQCLLLSNVQSIDTLLEKHPANALFQQLGKALMAWILEPDLTKVKELANPDAGDWLSLVWRRMYESAPTFAAFKQQNRIRFVTFNFDTLIEDRLSRGVAGLFPDGSYVAAREYFDSIVTHVHGKLELRPHGQEMDEWLANAVAAMEVVHQEHDAGAISAIGSQLENADVVCFLGFGYHESNIAKLGLPMPVSRRVFYGSMFGFGIGEVPEITKRLGNLGSWFPGDESTDCLAFLRSNHILRS